MSKQVQIIFILLLSLLVLPLIAPAQTSVPYSGESVWTTNYVYVPSVSMDIDTINGKPVTWYRDVIDTIKHKTQWIILDRVYQMTAEGTQIWEINASAIAEDGQSASYGIKLQKVIDYSLASVRNAPNSAAKKPQPTSQREGTLLILTPQGNFQGILFIEGNKILSHQ